MPDDLHRWKLGAQGIGSPVPSHCSHAHGDGPDVRGRLMSVEIARTRREHGPILRRMARRGPKARPGSKGGRRMQATRVQAVTKSSQEPLATIDLLLRPWPPMHLSSPPLHALLARLHLHSLSLPPSLRSLPRIPIAMGGKTSAVSSLLCCPCRCLFCGVLSCLFSVLACVLFAAGLAALVLFLLFRPHLIRATAVSADLTDFTLTQRTWILRYNLSLGLQVRNPNRRIALHYHGIVAQAHYDGQQFAQAAPPDFFQDTGDTSPLDLAFLGESPLVGGVAAAGYRREDAEGATFSVDVKVSSHMKLKLWVFRVPGPKTKIDCPLRLQRRDAAADAQHPPEFKHVECRVYFF